jgi:repressor LexA
MGRRPLLTTARVLAALERWTAANGHAPSLEELRRELRVASTRTVFRYLRKLEDEGAIERRPGAPGVKLLKPSKTGLGTRAVAVVGDVRAGTPALAEQNIDCWLRLPKVLAAPASDRFFLLRVRGMSMNRAMVVGETIEDGDLVLVRQQRTASSGDIVVALIDGEATVKRFVAAPGYFFLKPESTDETHQPIMVERDFRILGKVRRVLKKGSELMSMVFDAGATGE